MKGFIRQLSVGIATIMVVTLVGCVGGQSHNNDSFDVDSDLDVGTNTLAEADAPKDAGAGSPQASASSDDDFAEFDDAGSKQALNPPAESAPGGNDELSLEDEITSANGDKSNAQAQQAAPTEPAAPAAPEEDPFAEPPAQSAEVPPPAEPEHQQAQAPIPPPETPAELPPVETMAPQEPAPAPVVSTPAASTTEITGLRYQANDTGGTIVVQANGPLTYTTRNNPDLKQFIVEVQNAHLPKKLTRNLNTKDIRGTIGTIDAYQNPGSNTARFVIQLREGASEPAVQAEGNSLVIASSHAPEAASEANVAHESGTSDDGEVTNVAATGSDDKMLASQSLSEFMAGNTKFYGKKISIETSQMEVRDALKFITDETGVNMVISDEVRGNLSLKLRQVPWDQALVMILKARKLGYTRQGSVLRIAPLADLKQEEDDAAKLAASRKGFEPLKVRMFPVNFAKVDDLEKKIKDFLSERGKAVGDVRTNSLVITDLEDNLGRIAKLIASLDIQPPQVLIEGKIVEANELFTRSIGINWGATGQSIKIGNSNRGPVNMRPTFNVGQSNGTASNPLVFGLNIGTLDIFGNLSASLSLNEQENNVKVLSSPRIVTMSNEKANITQTTEIPLRTTTMNGATTQTTIQFKPLTLKLEVTPQVTADASVIMNVLVNRQFLGANVANTGDEQRPVNSREAQTKVLVHNGQTAVIGGIYQSDTTIGNQGVPWFKDLPVVGTLFRKTDTTKDKTELMIFLTPRILGQNEASAAPVSKDL